MSPPILLFLPPVGAGVIRHLAGNRSRSVIFYYCVRYFHGRTCSVGSVGTSFGLSYLRFFCSVFVRHIDYVVYLVVNSLSSFWYL